MQQNRERDACTRSAQQTRRERQLDRNHQPGKPLADARRNLQAALG
jgi:hypothetical protein